MHYILIIAVIAIIVIIQIGSYRNTTKRKLWFFKRIFAEKDLHYFIENHAETVRQNKIAELHSKHKKELTDLDSQMQIELDNLEKEKEKGISVHTNYYQDFLQEQSLIKKKYSNQKSSSEIHCESELKKLQRQVVPNIFLIGAKEKIEAEKANSYFSANHILQTIFGSINNYLSKNKDKDFLLMKDIVDRNCDAAEEEIHTQIPVPLYLGLAGTMLGILIGVGFLVFSGELNNLLGTAPTGAIKWVVDLFGAKPEGNGVETLLGGVAIAMIASFIGIILTTLASNSAKNAKIEVEKNKNTFLSWLQGALLPKMDNSVTHTLETMTANLSDFNKTFIDNTTNLGSALANVNESYKLQSTLMAQQRDIISALQQISNRDVIQKSAILLGKLIECSGTIGSLAQYLNSCNQYLANVKALNDKLDTYDHRSQVIENAGEFYKRHDSILSGNISDIKKKTEESLNDFSEALKTSLRNIHDDLNGQLLDFAKINENQQTMLNEKTKEIELIVEALKMQTETMQKQTEQNNSVAVAVAHTMRSLEDSTRKQNEKIDKLTDAILGLAKAKGKSAEKPPKSNKKMVVSVEKTEKQKNTDRARESFFQRIVTVFKPKKID
jgi:hypothetical protein